MNPTIKWLNSSDDGQTSMLFLLDSDSYSLYRIEKQCKAGSAVSASFSIDPVSVCSPLLPGGTRQEQELVRSFALDHTGENRLAIGFTNGRINIVSANIDPGIKYLRGEDIREAQKSITFLDWNFTDSSRLCAVYERSRGADHAVVVYDLNRSLRNVREVPMSVFEANFAEKVLGVCWFKEDPNLLLIGGTRGIRIADIREHGSFHSTLSVQNPLMGFCSEPNHGHRFACHAHNTVFVYDRRYLSSSPLHEIEACSSAKTLNKLSWHRRRLFHLTALAKDSGNLFHLSISSAAFAEQQNNLAGPADPSEIYRHLDPSQRNGLDAAEHSYAVHLYSVPEVNALASFDWHPTVSERLALFSAQEKRMVHSQTIAVPKRICIINLREDVNSAIGAGGDFVISGGRKLNFESSDGFLSQSAEDSNIVDMEKLFKRRILAGYGYGNTLNPSSTLLEYSRKAIEEDPLASEDLRFCWDWLWMLFQSSDASEVQKNYGTIFAGVKHILKGTKSSSTIKQDEITYRNRIFVNEKRLKILRMCNWPNYAVRDECKARFDEIAEQGGGVSGITRAAALALFSVQGLLSKEHLTHLSEYTHSREFAETAGHSSDFVANYQRMAETVLNVLQKYDGVRVPDYENVCEKLVGDDYLLAIVKFLARRDKIYNRIYNEIFESKMALKDKLAFAAIHMDDDFLGTALEKLVDRLTSERPLSALLVIGLDDQPESHQLLHRYLDQTGDLQTVSLLLATGNCFRKCAMLQGTTVTSSVGVKASELLERAIESEARGNLRRKSLHCFRDYVQLLNRWKFWLVKTFICLFLRPKNGTGEVDRSKVTSVQAVIACNFCALPIYPTIAERIESLRVYTPKIASFSRRLGPNSRTRTMSCLCRKPLPKCVICRKHLGNALEPESGQCDEGNAASVIDHWVVWCSSCSHGGHLAHVRDWFSEYPMCAASGCECNCVKRDHQLRDELIGSSFGMGEDCQ